MQIRGQEEGGGYDVARIETRIDEKERKRERERERAKDG